MVKGGGYAKAVAAVVGVVKIPMPAMAHNPQSIATSLHGARDEPMFGLARPCLPGFPGVHPIPSKLGPSYDRGAACSCLEMDAPCWLQRHHRRVRSVWVLTISCVRLSLQAQLTTTVLSALSCESSISSSNAYSRIGGLPGQEAHRPAHVRRRRLQ